MAITIGCILIGDLNAIAPLITNFFMASYALTNLAVYEASASKSPGWRPTFKYYNKWLSLFGTFLCFGFMLFLNVWMSFFTVMIGILLYILVGKVAPNVNWGSSGEGAKYIMAYRSLRSSLLYSHNNKEASNTIIVSSTGPGEGKTTTISNLAITLTSCSTYSLCCSKKGCSKQEAKACSKDSKKACSKDSKKACDKK